MNKNNYTYNGAEGYCYPGTNVLKNKLNIKDDEALAIAEKEVWWYYINASEGIDYIIGQTSFLSGWMKDDENLSWQWTPTKVTCYREDGTIFGTTDPRNEDFLWELDYYSPIDQKLYISFEFIATGYCSFYYDEYFRQ